MTARPHSGRFIVLEGIDGAGTTTQAQALGQALELEGKKVQVTREPSDGPVGALVRQALVGQLMRHHEVTTLNPSTLALLFAADRLDHLASEILPALQRGEWVVCDRYLLSSLAYQGIDNDVDWVEQVNRYAVEPDLTLFLEVPADVAAKRRTQRGGKPELFEEDEAQRRIADEYLSAIRRRASRDRIVRLDGTLSKDEVTRLAMGAIRKTLEL